MVRCDGCGAIVETSAEPVCPRCGRTLPLADGPTVPTAATGGTDLRPGGEDLYGLLGQRVAQYEVQSLIGTGGMAAVYLVRHVDLDRLSALKVPLPRYTDLYRLAPEEFFSEARLAARLVHRCIVTIHNIGQIERIKLPFIEMEYVPGGSLSTRVRSGQGIEALTVARWMVDVAAGLAEAHRHDVLHRDVKPSNVFLASDGGAKLGDFGLARLKQTVTRRETGRAAGTPAFMAPEVIRGAEPIPATDVYSFGVTFFAVLAGRLPFVGQATDELLDAHLYRPAPNVREFNPTVPEPVARVIDRCLAKKPEDRYANGAELLMACNFALGEARGLDQLLHEALASTQLVPEVVETSQERFLYRVVVPLPADRRQIVYIEATRERVLAERVVRVYSFCAPARPSYYEDALALNASLPHAKVGIQPKGDQLWFVVSNVYPRATCDPEELKLSILQVAEWADRLEQTLTGADIY